VFQATEAANTITAKFPDLDQKFRSLHEDDANGLLSFISNGVQAMDKAYSEVLRDNSSYRGQIVAKDKKIDEQETAVTQARQTKGIREEALVKEVNKLHSEKTALAAKLEAALKEPWQSEGGIEREDPDVIWQSSRC
jgi:predicted  nucleic acid-binding Zn-ribbon protein